MIIFDLDGCLIECDSHKKIIPTLMIFSSIVSKYNWSKLEIWTGRCETLRDETASWFFKEWFVGLNFEEEKNFKEYKLKMRSIGENASQEILKERWLDQCISKGKTIDFVFDSDPKSIQMWKRHEIFVFDCSQNHINA